MFAAVDLYSQCQFSKIVDVAASSAYSEPYVGIGPNFICFSVMSRLYANLGNLAPTWRLVVLAAVSLLVWLAGAQNEACASCGDYVKVANPRVGMVSYETDTVLGLDSRFMLPTSSVPTLPCRGPYCGRGAPITPLAPAPVVVQTLAEQFAALALFANQSELANGLPLAECQVHPLAGYSSPLKRPPRA